MRIGVNARLLITNQPEGIPRYIFEIVYHMAVQHPETTFILYHDRKVSYAMTFPPNVLLKVIPLMTRHPLLWFTWFDILLPFYLKRDQIDVFYSGDGFLSKRVRIPQVLVTHDLAYLHFPQHMIQSHVRYSKKNIPVFHQMADAIITVSETTKNDIISQWQIPEDKITVVYNAVDGALPETKGDISKKTEEISLSAAPYFFFVGALHPRKNIKNLCLGFSEFNKKNNRKYRLVLAGRYAWKSESIESLINQSEDIIHVGSVTESEKNLLYQKSEALVYLSLFEGFGIPILEAMKLKVPVITSDCSSMPEVAGDAALLADPNDINSISDALSKITQPEIKQNLIQKGRDRVQDFSWSKSASITYALIQSVFKKT
ncbi:MAG: glycosyltransferase family 4 protein [Saprospiraceae bacterium]|nr:glycosyltransferase family 4 protein [Saprospiraceae bacterium]